MLYKEPALLVPPKLNPVFKTSTGMAVIASFSCEPAARGVAVKVGAVQVFVIVFAECEGVFTTGFETPLVG